MFHFVHQLIVNIVFLLFGAGEVMHCGFLELFFPTKSSCNTVLLAIRLMRVYFVRRKTKSMTWKNPKILVDFCHYECLTNLTDCTPILSVVCVSKTLHIIFFCAIELCYHPKTIKKTQMSHTAAQDEMFLPPKGNGYWSLFSIGSIYSTLWACWATYHNFLTSLRNWQWGTKSWGCVVEQGKPASPCTSNRFTYFVNPIYKDEGYSTLVILEAVACGVSYSLDNVHFFFPPLNCLTQSYHTFLTYIELLGCFLISFYPHF